MNMSWMFDFIYCHIYTINLLCLLSQVRRKIIKIMDLDKEIKIEK